METHEALRLLQAMIDYFEAGNQDADAAAKEIIASDFTNSDHWQARIDRLVHGVEWSGLRAPEAELVATGLRTLQRLLAPRPQ